MKTDFKLIGLSRPKSMTCEPLNNENTFWPNVSISQERFDALWEYFDSSERKRMIAEIEHYGLTEDGRPIGGSVVNVREWNDNNIKVK